MGRIQTFKHRSGVRGSQRRLRFESLEGRRLLATYYINASEGSDANSGTSPDQAWASLAKVNSAALKGGDEVLLQRGSQWSGELRATRSGTASNPIRFRAYGTGARPEVFQIYVSGDHTIFEDLTVEHQKKSGDAVRVRGAAGVVLRDMEIRNGLNDGVDLDDADGIVMDGLYIHHFLAGSFSNQADAHGVVATGTRGLTIRNTEIHHVSGDSFQADPARNASDITTDILIEDSHFWTAPLEADFGAWRAGQRPGENAVDTKVVKDGWENVERMRLTLRNVTAHGWLADSYINNKAAFNMKEKVDAIFDGVTVYDSEIAFRLRGNRGNANVTIHNAVVFDVDKAIRAEDNLKNLELYNSTFGHGIKTLVQFAGGDGGKSTWDLRNNAFVGSKPGVANDPSNRIAVANDFIDSTSRDYRLATTSTLVDAGTTIAAVTQDRAGVARPQGAAHDVGAYERSVPLSPAPIAADDAVTAKPGLRVAIDVLANDVVDANSRLTLAIAAAPGGGTAVVNADNTIIYTPAANAEGPDRFTYIIHDERGRAATATVTILVEGGHTAIDLRDYSLNSYGGKQDAGKASVQDQGATLQVTGNAWKQIKFPYQVTPNTILEFDFRSSNQAEIHAIGFDSDADGSSEFGFQLYGTQEWGHAEFKNYASTAPQWKHYRIPVGEFYTGSFDRLFFVNDHDISRPTGESYYANIKVYERRPATTWFPRTDILIASASTPSGLVLSSGETLDRQEGRVVHDEPIDAEIFDWEVADFAAGTWVSLQNPTPTGDTANRSDPWAEGVDAVCCGSPPPTITLLSR